jgi:hypothetical protein
MWQVLASETEVVIHSGFVYVPLLFDLQIEAELALLAGAGGQPAPTSCCPWTATILSNLCR